MHENAIHGRQRGNDDLFNAPISSVLGWPMGMLGIVGHDSCVYSIRGSAGEYFYFNAGPEEVRMLIDIYSQISLHEHNLAVKRGKKEVVSFDGERIPYNVSYDFPCGRSKSSAHGWLEGNAHGHKLAVYLDYDVDREWWSEITIPGNIIVHREVEGV